MLLCMPVSSDRLPGGVAENQVWTTTSLIEGVGVTTETTSLNWYTSDAGLTELPKPYPDTDVSSMWRGSPWTGSNYPISLLTPSPEEYNVLSSSIAYMVYKESIKSNGGQISEVKTFSLDTNKKTEGLYNIESEKVLTYTSQNGSHLMGAESYLLDVSGMWSKRSSDLVCVFSRSEQEIIPAFCNKVTASSKLRSVTTAQVESIGTATVVGTSPAALNYEIAVMPDSNSASGYADAIVSTTFTVNVMEGRTDQWKGGDPLRDGRWEFTGTGWYWNPLNSGNGITEFYLDRSLNSNFVDVHYEGTLYRAGGLGQTITGPSVPMNGINPLPPEAQFSVDGGDGTGPYIVTYMGAVYSIDPSDIVSAPYDLPVTLLHPGLPNFDELASTITAQDTATISGGISNFVKSFNYVSGIGCQNC